MSTSVTREEWPLLRLIQTFHNKPQDIERMRIQFMPPSILPPTCDFEGCSNYCIGLYATPDGRAAALCAGHAPIQTRAASH